MKFFENRALSENFLQRLIFLVNSGNWAISLNSKLSKPNFFHLSYSLLTFFYSLLLSVNLEFYNSLVASSTSCWMLFDNWISPSNSRISISDFHFKSSVSKAEFSHNEWNFICFFFHHIQVFRQMRWFLIKFGIFSTEFFSTKYLHQIRSFIEFKQLWLINTSFS